MPLAARPGAVSRVIKNRKDNYTPKSSQNFLASNASNGIFQMSDDDILTAQEPIKSFDQALSQYERCRRESMIKILDEENDDENEEGELLRINSNRIASEEPQMHTKRPKPSNLILVDAEKEDYHFCFYAMLIGLPTTLLLWFLRVAFGHPDHLKNKEEN